jgi:hypothetical protein
MADNTMAKGKKTNGQTTIYKTLHRKLQTKQHKRIMELLKLKSSDAYKDVTVLPNSL